jgi:hypothetical protein
VSSRIWLLRVGAAAPVRSYRVGSDRLSTDVEAGALEPFLDGERAGTTTPTASHAVTPGEPGADLDTSSNAASPLFDDVVELGGAARSVRCDRLERDSTYRIEIALEPALATTARDHDPASDARALRCRVDGDGAVVSYDFRGPPPPELAELLLGAPLLLALALRGTFCLHGSAVLAPEGVVAFLGESGAGKSTLARELVRCGMERIADDLLLVRSGSPPVAIPRFPQPRLAPSEQPAAAPLEAPLAAIYLLGGHADRAQGERLASVAAALALARHTVAARLFDQDLLERHLAFAASLAAAAPVRHLRYPWRPGGVEIVAATIRRDLDTRAEDTDTGVEP